MGIIERHLESRLRRCREDKLLVHYVSIVSGKLTRVFCAGAGKRYRAEVAPAVGDSPEDIQVRPSRQSSARKYVRKLCATLCGSSAGFRRAHARAQTRETSYCTVLRLIAPYCVNTVLHRIASRTGADQGNTAFIMQIMHIIAMQSRTHNHRPRARARTQGCKGCPLDRVVRKYVLL